MIDINAKVEETEPIVAPLNGESIAVEQDEGNERRRKYPPRFISLVLCILLAYIFQNFANQNFDLTMCAVKKKTSAEVLTTASSSPQEEQNEFISPSSDSFIRLHNSSSVGGTMSIEELRKELVGLSLDIMERDTVQAAEETIWVDIGEVVDFFDKAVEIIGVEGVFRQIFPIKGFVSTYNVVARERGLVNFEASSFKLPNMKPRVAYDGTPNDRDYGLVWEMEETGNLWWMVHWFGAILADRILHNETIPLKGGGSPEMVTDAPSMMKIFQSLCKVPDSPDIAPFHAQHGFTWHYMVGTEMHTILETNEYPTALARYFCGDYLYKDDFVPAVSNYVGLECLHGFGHGLYYVMAMEQLDLLDASKRSVRKQIRQRAGLELSTGRICRLMSLCKKSSRALGLRVEGQCMGGFFHSVFLFGTQDFKTSVETMYSFEDNIKKVKKMCIEEQDNHLLRRQVK